MAPALVEVHAIEAFGPAGWRQLGRQRGQRVVSGVWVWPVGPSVGTWMTHVAQASATRSLGRFGFARLEHW